MAGVGSGRVLLKSLRKHSIVILFPTFTAATIYADLSHTRTWKQSLLAASQKNTTELLPQ